MYHTWIPAFRLRESGELEEVSAWIQWDEENAWVSADGSEVQNLDLRRAARARLHDEEVFAIVADDSVSANAFDPRTVSRTGIDVLGSTGSREEFSVADSDTHGSILVCKVSHGRVSGNLVVEDLQYHRFEIFANASGVAACQVEPVVVEKTMPFATIDGGNVHPGIQISGYFGRSCRIDCGTNYVRKEMFLLDPDLRALPEKMVAVFTWNGGLDVDTLHSKGVKVIAQDTDPAKVNRWKSETYPTYLVISADDPEGLLIVEDFVGHRMVLAPRMVDGELRVKGSVKKIGENARRAAVRLNVFDPDGETLEKRHIGSIAHGPKPQVFVRRGGNYPIEFLGKGNDACKAKGIQAVQLAADSGRTFDLSTRESSAFLRFLAVSADKRTLFCTGQGWFCIDLDNGKALLVDLKPGQTLPDIQCV